MPATAEQRAYAEKLRDLLTKAVKFPPQFYTRNGEYYSISVIDCKGKPLITTPIRSVLSDFSERNMPVQTECRDGVKFYLTFYSVVAGEKPQVVSIKSKKQPIYRKRNKLLSAKEVVFILPEKGPNSLSSMIELGRATVRGRVKRLRRKGPFDSSRGLRPSPEIKSSTWLYYKNRSGPTVPGSPIETTVVTPFTPYSRSWTGVRTPNFGALLNTGKLPINAHTVHIKYLSRPDSYYRIYDRTWKVDEWRIDNFYSWSLLNWLTDPAFSTLVRNKAVQRASKKANGNAEGNVAVAVAEADQVVRMMGNTMERLSGGMTNLRRGNVAGAVRAVWQGKTPRFRKGGGPKPGQSLAQNWLELQYGWKPLLGDIHGGLESLSRFFESQKGAYYQLTASAKDKLETFQPLTDDDSHVKIIGGYSTVTDYRCKIGLRYRVSEPLVNFLAQTGFTNAPNLAWELLPFSFVLDWILPIGPYLESLSSWHGLEFVDGYQTEFVRRRAFGYMASTIYNAGSNTDRTYDGQQTGEEVKLKRTKLISFPSLTRPELRNPMSSATRAANAWAVAVSVFAR